MYPVRSRIVKNTFFLGEQLPSAAELMDTDPAVAAIRIQLQYANEKLQEAQAAPWFQARPDRSGVKWENRHGSIIFPPPSAGVQVHVHGWDKVKNANAHAVKRQTEYDHVKAKLSDAEKRVWDRISKDIPYKAYIIKPIVDRGANTIVYQLTKGGANIGTPHQQLDEAKAVVDNEIAAEQSKQVQQWAEERGAAEGVLPAQQKTMVPPPEGTVTVVTDTPPSNTTKYLLIGGAALAALMLMK